MARKRWLVWPAAVLAVAGVAGTGFVGVRLGGTQPGMYDRVGVAEGEQCLDTDTVAETIVYTSLRPGNLDVYLFDRPGAPPRRITNDYHLNYDPVLVPGGDRIVFASDRDGATNLFVVAASEGAEAVPLTTGMAMDGAPTLSPDGTLLAFASTRHGDPDVFVMPFEPGNAAAETAAVNLTDHPFGDFKPAFSPDGSRIAFSTNRALFRRWNPLRLVPGTNAMAYVYVMDRDGSNVRRVAAGIGISGSPAWTEDGTALLYYRTTDPSNSAVYRTPIRGRGTVRLSPEGMAAFTPTAGPDGTVIFVGVDDTTPPAGAAALQPRGRLYQVAADGTGLTALTDPGRGYLAPHYDAASGRLVAYGDAPVDEAARMANGTPFTWPGATRRVRLPDRCVAVHAVRSYFPSLSDGSDRVVTVPWVHEANGVPPGPAPIVSAALDGSDMQQLYTPPDDGFAWSPVVTRDGAWIYFSRGARFGGPQENVEIWKVRSDGSGVVHLSADSDANDAFPDVSADGSRVVFRSGRAGGGPGRAPDGKGIYVMNADGSGARPLADAAGDNTMPAISPDGQWVVFSTTRTGRGWKLWIQSLVDENDPGRLLEPDRARLSGRDMHPRFSPDGRWIVFTSDRAGFMDEIVLSGMYPQPYGELFAVPADGSHAAIRLTHDRWEDGLPFWGNPRPSPP